MCGRFTLIHPDFEEIAEALGATFEPTLVERYKPRYNIAPTDAHWVVVRSEKGAEKRALVGARWGLGLPPRGNVINLRSEGARKASFQKKLDLEPCIVPADGFYEWHGPKGKRKPLWFRPRTGGLMWFAGLCAREDAELDFAILTTPANDFVRPIHGRMPAILSSDEDVRRWLAGDGDVVCPAPDGFLDARAVSSRVGSVKNDDPSVLSPDESEQLSFDGLTRPLERVTR